MKVTIVFYGGLKQDVGGKHATLELPGDSATIHDLAAALVLRYPALAPRLDTVAYAVGSAIVTPDHVLYDGDEAALLPPVSGG